MGYVRTFTGIIPPARADELPWVEAQIHEAETRSGPWVEIDSFVFTDPDDDPAAPAPRDFTTEEAQHATAWYRIVFADADGDTADGPWFFIDDDGQPSWLPSVQEVAGLVWARTKEKGSGGQRVGTFTANTSPTAEEALRLIRQAGWRVAAKLTADPCKANLREGARAATALYASMLIESSYWPEQTEAAGSSFQARLKLWERQLDDLAELVKANCTGGEGEDEEGTAGAALAAGGFDDGELLYGRDYPPEGPGGW